MRIEKPQRLQGIDGLRAVAITAVVIFHAEPGFLPGGFLGVDLFFVISGFLITRQLLAEVAGDGGLDLVAFYRRRMRRLFPPMLSMLVAVTIGAIACWPDEIATLRGDLPAALAYLANWHQILAHRSYFQASGRPSPLQHLWSLAIEEQFYLLWPLLLLLVAATPRRVRRKRPASSPAHRDAGRVAVLAIIGAAASTAWMWVLAIRGDVPFGSDSSRLYFGSDTHAAGLLIGAALAAVVARRRVDLRSSSTIPMVAGALALTALGWSFFHVSEFSPGLYRGGFAVIAGLSAISVLGASQQGGWLSRLLELPALRFIGTRSYAIYLWHWPIIVVTRPGLDLGWPAPVTLLLRLIAPVLLADLSYRLLEQRSRRVEQAFARLSYLPWRLVTLPVAIALLLAVTVVPGRSSAATATPDLAPVRQVAAARLPAGLPAPRTSTATVSTALVRVVPTSAAPLGRVLAVGDSVLLGAAPDLHADLRMLTVDAVVGRQARPTLQVVDATRPLPDAVVISTGNNGVIDRSDLEKTLRLLKNRRVVIVTDNVPRDWQDPNNVILRAAASRHPGAVIFDWLALSIRHADWFYDDGFHVRPAGAAAYASGITRALHLTTPLV